MDLLKVIFPMWKLRSRNDIKDLIINIVIYLIGGIIGGVVLALAGLITGWIPALGAILSILFGAIGGIIELYILVGIVIEILLFAKVIKD